MHAMGHLFTIESKEVLHVRKLPERLRALSHVSHKDVARGQVPPFQPTLPFACDHKQRSFVANLERCGIIRKHCDLRRYRAAINQPGITRMEHPQRTLLARLGKFRDDLRSRCRRLRRCEAEGGRSEEHTPEL